MDLRSCELAVQSCLIPSRQQKSALLVRIAYRAAGIGQDCCHFRIISRVWLKMAYSGGEGAPKAIGNFRTMDRIEGSRAGGLREIVEIRARG